MSQAFRVSTKFVNKANNSMRISKFQYSKYATDLQKNKKIESPTIQTPTQYTEKSIKDSLLDSQKTRSSKQNKQLYCYQSYYGRDYAYEKNEGLPNVGNTCFLNSVIQLLFSAKKFRKQAISFQDPYQSSFTYTLGQIFSSMESCLDRDTKRSWLLYFTQLLMKQNPYYRSYSQQDAFDFLISILSKIRTQNRGIQQLFNIQYQNSCRCRSFNVKFLDIYLQKGKQFCQNCKQQSKIIFHYAPEYVILMGDGTSSHDQQIKYKLYNSNFAQTYKLCSMIIYIGNGYSGHYISIRREENKISYSNLLTNNMIIEEKQKFQKDQRTILKIPEEPKIFTKALQQKQETVNERELYSLNKIYFCQILVIKKLIQQEEKYIFFYEKRNLYFKIEKQKYSFSLPCFGSGNKKIIIKILNSKQFFFLQKEILQLNDNSDNLKTLNNILAQVKNSFEVFVKNNQLFKDSKDRGKYYQENIKSSLLSFDPHSSMSNSKIQDIKIIHIQRNPQNLNDKTPTVKYK